MLVTKKAQALRSWREHLANVQKFKDGCFQLLAHPDAKPADIESIRRMAINVAEQHTNLLNTMRSKGYDV